jgi:hypothetical protein
MWYPFPTVAESFILNAIHLGWLVEKLGQDDHAPGLPTQVHRWADSVSLAAEAARGGTARGENQYGSATGLQVEPRSTK